MTLKSTVCANCDRAIDGPEQKYCPNCGQRTPVSRIDWHFLVHEVPHSIFHVDGGILYTLAQLLTRPGHTIREYVQGQRIRHFKPLLLIVILGAVVTLIAQTISGHAGLFPVDAMTLTSGGAESLKPGTPEARVVGNFRSTLGWMNEHLAITLIALLPFYAIAMRMAFRKFRAEYTYPEWLVMSCFLTAQAMVIYGIFLILRQVSPLLASWDTVAIVVAQLLTLMQLFNGYPWWKTLLRTALAYSYYGLMVMVLITVGALLLVGDGVGWDRLLIEIRN